MTGTRNETIVASKGQEAGMKPHEVSIVLGHDGGHVVEPELACHTGHGFEGMDVAAHQSLKRLAVVNSRYIFRLWHSMRQKAYSFRGAFIHKRADVTPV